jgi:hypothetical protein
MTVTWIIEDFEPENTLLDYLERSGKQHKLVDTSFRYRREHREELLNAAFDKATFHDNQVSPYVFMGTTGTMDVLNYTSLFNIWYDHESFSCLGQAERLGHEALNKFWYVYPNELKEWFQSFDCKEQVSSLQDHTRIFVKPNMGNKRCESGVLSTDQIDAYLSSLEAENYKGLLAVTRTLRVNHISNEWRLFIGPDNKIITGSQYKDHSGLKLSPEVPSEVVKYVDSFIHKKQLVPHPFYVLDVCSAHGWVSKFDGPTDFFSVVELNSFNSSGWYAADVEKIVHAVEEYLNG